MEATSTEREGRYETLVILLALGFDLIGEPPARFHPVVWYGKLIRALEGKAPRGSWAQLLYGAGMLLVALVFVGGVVRLFQCAVDMVRRRGTSRLRGLGVAVLTGVALKPFFAWRMLAEAGARVRRALEREDLEAAREELGSLVSRERSWLSSELVAAAAIESLAENLSDSVVAPLCYYALFGLPGAALYRLVNTFDSLVGYHGAYEYLGKVAARLDDVLNLVPSRLTALLIIVCARLYGGEGRAAWKIWRRDAGKTESPNAGQPMAAAAGALGLRLEKVGHYVLGDERRALTPAAIAQAERMVWWVGGCAFLCALSVRMLRKRRK